MDGQPDNNDDYQTADEYAFVTTARSFQEVEEIVAGEYFSNNTFSEEEYDSDHKPGDAPERLYLPNPRYNFAYQPPSHPSMASHVYFTETTNREGWTTHIDRPSFTYYFTYSRSPTPLIRALLERTDSQSSGESILSDAGLSYTNMSDISSI